VGCRGDGGLRERCRDDGGLVLCLLCGGGLWADDEGGRGRRVPRQWRASEELPRAR
jgi:hypothetical protein